MCVYMCVCTGIDHLHHAIHCIHLTPTVFPPNHYCTHTGDNHNDNRYRSKYLDRSSVYLPPSAYHLDDVESKWDETKHENPTSQTALSLLCVATGANTVQLFLHGRYLIAELPVDKPKGMVCSSDLSTVVVVTEHNTLRVFSLRAMATRHRFSLQTVSSMYCSIQQHMTAIGTVASEIVASWKNALRPLDTKIGALGSVIRSYGGDPSNLSSILIDYIMMGSATEHAPALEQFFTGVQMNDQLVVRMEKSLHNALANIEAMTRQKLLSPARSLVYDVSELYGLDDDLLPDTMPLHKVVRILLLSCEHVVAQIVQTRFLVQNLVSWLRSTGAAVKARGTATGSVQQQNARKRRVSSDVVDRIVACLQVAKSNSLSPSASGSATETLLGSKVTVSLCYIPIG